MYQKSKCGNYTGKEVRAGQVKRAREKGAEQVRRLKKLLLLNGTFVKNFFFEFGCTNVKLGKVQKWKVISNNLKLGLSIIQDKKKNFK